LAGDISPGRIDKAGKDARFRNPRGIAVFVDGSLIIADTHNHQIRKISPLGFVTTLAGSGQQGFTNGPALGVGLGLYARFAQPRGVAVRPDGTIVVADTENHRIRLISPAGFVTTLAGSGVKGFADGSAAEAQFKSPIGVAVCPDGAVLVCDWANRRIRRIAPDGTVDTVAGSGVVNYLDGIGEATSFTYPYSIAVDTDGHAVVGEVGRIRKIVLTTGEVTTVGVFETNTIIDALAIDPDGSVVFFNTATQTLAKITNAGLGPGFSAEKIMQPWTPTRKSHRNTPEWSRDAVNTMALITTRARYSNRLNTPNSEWLSQVPLLPQMVWGMIIGLIPIHHIGRPDWATIPAYDPVLAQWFARQIALMQKITQEEDASQNRLMVDPHPTTSITPMGGHPSE